MSVPPVDTPPHPAEPAVAIPNAASRSTHAVRRWHPGGALAAYLRATRQPLYNLIFLFPLVGTYVLGSLIAARTGWEPRGLVAERLIGAACGWIGLQGAWVAGALLLGTLLAWHLTTRRGWQVHLAVFPMMVVEAAVLTIPLLVLHALLLQIGGGELRGWTARSLQALGAGLYEELTFRLLLVGGLIWLVRRGLRWKTTLATTLVVLIGAVLFSAAHVLPVGSEAFDWTRFIHRAFAGAYLGAVFLQRGLGIAVGCHVGHNLLLLASSAR